MFFSKRNYWAFRYSLPPFLTQALSHPFSFVSSFPFQQSSSAAIFMSTITRHQCANAAHRKCTTLQCNITGATHSSVPTHAPTHTRTMLAYICAEFRNRFFLTVEVGVTQIRQNRSLQMQLSFPETFHLRSSHGCLGRTCCIASRCGCITRKQCWHT